MMATLKASVFNTPSPKRTATTADRITLRVTPPRAEPMANRMRDPMSELKGRMISKKRCNAIMERNYRTFKEKQKETFSALSALERFGAYADDMQESNADKAARRRQKGKVCDLIDEIDRALPSPRKGRKKRHMERTDPVEPVKRPREKENLSARSVQTPVSPDRRKAARPKRRPAQEGRKTRQQGRVVMRSVSASHPQFLPKSRDSPERSVKPDADGVEEKLDVKASSPEECATLVAPASNVEARFAAEETSSTDGSGDHNSDSAKIMSEAETSDDGKPNPDVPLVSSPNTRLNSPVTRLPTPSCKSNTKGGQSKAEEDSSSRKDIQGTKKRVCAQPSLPVSQIGGSPPRPSKRKPTTRESEPDIAKSRKTHETEGKGKSPNETPRRMSNRLRNGRREKHPDIRLRALSEKEKDKYESITTGAKKRVIVDIKEANIELCGRDFSRLRASRWLSDELMNSFIALVNSRNMAYVAKLECPEVTPELLLLTTKMSKAGLADERTPSTSEGSSEKVTVDEEKGKVIHVFNRPRPRTHIFNTFFFTRLTHGDRYDYDGVKRWLQRADQHVSELDLIMFPINVNNLHWVLTAIDLRGRKLLYFDSIGGDDVLDTMGILRRWLADEVLDKCGEERLQEMNIDSWDVEVDPSYMPRQNDYGSCGVFILYTAEFLERGVCPSFEQGDMAVLRQRTALFLSEGTLPN